MFTCQWLTIPIAIVLQCSVPGWMRPTRSNRGFLSCTLCPARLGCVYEVDSEWTVRNANTVSYWYIPECPSDCATCSFLSSYSSVQPVLSSYNERVMPLKRSETGLDWMFPGNAKRLVQCAERRPGLVWAASVSVAVGKLVDRQRVIRFTSTSVVTWYQANQEFAKLVKAITLPFYGCVLFYPSTECMSTECPVTSLL